MNQQQLDVLLVIFLSALGAATLLGLLALATL